MTFKDLVDKEVYYLKEKYTLKAIRQVPFEYCQRNDYFVVDIQKDSLTFPVNWSIIKYENEYLDKLIDIKLLE